MNCFRIDKCILYTRRCTYIVCRRCRCAVRESCMTVYMFHISYLDSNGCDVIHPSSCTRTHAYMQACSSIYIYRPLTSYPFFSSSKCALIYLTACLKLCSFSIDLYIATCQRSHNAGAPVSKVVTYHAACVDGGAAGKRRAMNRFLKAAEMSKEKPSIMIGRHVGGGRWKYNYGEHQYCTTAVAMERRRSRSFIEYI
jgi:hypothetical protein